MKSLENVCWGANSASMVHHGVVPHVAARTAAIETCRSQASTHSECNPNSTYSHSHLRSSCSPVLAAVSLLCDLQPFRLRELSPPCNLLLVTSAHAMACQRITTLGATATEDKAPSSTGFNPRAVRISSTTSSQIFNVDAPLNLTCAGLYHDYSNYQDPLTAPTHQTRCARAYAVVPDRL